jgi:hypothetical protein
MLYLLKFAATGNTPDALHATGVSHVDLIVHVYRRANVIGNDCETFAYPVFPDTLADV